MRRLVEDQRGLLLGQRFQQVGALSRLGRQEAAEVERVGGQAGAGQRGERGRGTRHGLHRDAGIDGGAHQAVAGVGDQRHAGVGDQRDHGAADEAGSEFFGALRLVVVVIAHRRLVDIVVIQQFARLPRVFARDQVGLAQHADGAIGDVLEVPDGRRHEVEQTGHLLSISGVMWARRCGLRRRPQPVV